MRRLHDPTAAGAEFTTGRGGPGAIVRDQRHQCACDSWRGTVAERWEPKLHPQQRRPPCRVLSARSEQALAGHGAAAAGCRGQPDLDPIDVGWSLVKTRAMFEHRAVVGC